MSSVLNLGEVFNQFWEERIKTHEEEAKKGDYTSSLIIGFWTVLPVMVVMNLNYYMGQALMGRFFFIAIMAAVTFIYLPWVGKLVIKGRR